MLIFPTDTQLYTHSDTVCFKTLQLNQTLADLNNYLTAS